MTNLLAEIKQGQVKSINMQYLLSFHTCPNSSPFLFDRLKYQLSISSLANESECFSVSSDDAIFLPLYFIPNNFHTLITSNLPLIDINKFC